MENPAEETFHDQDRRMTAQTGEEIQPLFMGMQTRNS